MFCFCRIICFAKIILSSTRRFIFIQIHYHFNHSFIHLFRLNDSLVYNFSFVSSLIFVLVLVLVRSISTTKKTRICLVLSILFCFGFGCVKSQCQIMANGYSMYENCIIFFVVCVVRHSHHHHHQHIRTNPA